MTRVAQSIVQKMIGPRGYYFVNIPVFELRSKPPEGSRGGRAQAWIQLGHLSEQIL